MELTIGSRVFRGTSGVLIVQGKQQLSLEWGMEPHQLLLTMNLYNAGGMHIARVRRNAWTFNDRDRFELSAARGVVKLIDTTTGEVVVEARVVGRDKLEIPRGCFCTNAGHRVEITPEYCHIGGQATSVTEIVGGPSAVAMG
jgi:hypothetical protein